MRIAAALLLLNVVLNAVLFLPGEGVYRDSIEAGYVSMANFIAAHPSPFGWNPMQYCGMPTHLWYLPVVPYTVAGLSRILPAVGAAEVHRIFVTLAGCALPVVLFFFALYFTRDRKWAAVTALAYTFISPAYGLFRTLDFDRGVTYLPWRMQVLVKYGEGPHMLGFALMPLALMACWRAATGRRYAQILLAAVLLAAVCLTNWVAALSTAWCCLALLVAGFTYGGETGFRVRRLLAAAALGYLLACFWLTPRFVQTTMLNWPADAFNYQLQAAQWALFGVGIASAAALWFALMRLPGTPYLRFLAIAFWGFFFIVACHYWFGIDVIPESRRYAPEMEFFLIAGMLELARQLFADERRRSRDFAVAVLTLAIAPGAFQVVQYIGLPWLKLRPTPREQTIEYRVASFLAARQPQGRVFATGGTRFRLNSWYTLPQVGGTFESGLRNRTPVYWINHVRWGTGSRPERRGQDSVLILRMAGVQYIAVHGRGSQEHWRDINPPEQFRGLLPVALDADEDVVYGVPYNGLAHLMRPEEMPAKRPVEHEIWRAEPYVRALDDAARPRLEARWQGASRLDIRGPVPAGMLVSAMISYDGGWRATQDGRPLPVQQDKMDYILLQPSPAGFTDIVLEYHPTREQVAMTMLSALSWACALGWWWIDRRRQTRPATEKAGVAK